MAVVNHAQPYVSPVEVADVAWYDEKYVTNICCRNEVVIRHVEESKSNGLSGGEISTAKQFSN